MLARVKKESKFSNITMARMEFVKYEFRTVPAGFEAEAARNQFLEVTDNQPEPAPAVIEDEPTPKKKKRAE